MSMQRRFDLSVYFVTDPECCAGRAVTEVVAAAARGGATLVQLRDKSGMYIDAAVVQDILKPFGIPLIINDRPDVAKTIDADGVHLGQGDMKPEDARSFLGPDKIIGLTAFRPEHFAAIDPAVVDYAGTGPVWPTKTDKGKPVLGVEGFARMVPLSPVPVVGIGGITPENAASVIAAGAAGVAMMRAVSEAADPEAVVRKFREALS